MPSRPKASGMMPRSGTLTPFSRMSEPVIAAMPMKLPTSIMSGSRRCVAPPSESTPSMTSRFEPMPDIFAPIRVSMRHSCCMYGSHAALYIVVVPSASTAAIIRLAVPVIDASSSSTYAPFSRPSHDMS